MFPGHPLSLSVSFFFQVDVRKACGWLVLRFAFSASVGIYYICVSALITCAIICHIVYIVAGAMQTYLVDFGNLDDCFV